MRKVAHAGSLPDTNSRELAKLGMSLGARLDGATHAHTRKALAAGAMGKEICHVSVLAISMLGLPASVIALT